MARWTFDPLVARNAWFNLGKLGAVADRFGRAFYGEMTDEINAGDRTDRLVVRWDLDPEPAGRVLAGGPPRPCSRPRAIRTTPVPVPGSAPPPTEPSWRSRASMPDLRSRDPALGARWREATAEALEACFGAGLIAGAFDRDPVRVRAGARGAPVSRVRAVELLLVELPLVRPFRTSFGEVSREAVRPRSRGDRRRARAGGSASPTPGPTSAESSTMAPGSCSGTSSLPRCSGPATWTSRASRSRFADGPREPDGEGRLLDAFVDAELRADGTSLASWLGAERSRVECGVSIGIAPSTDVAPRAGRRLPRGGLPADQAEDRAGHRRRARARRAGRAPGHPAVRRRERRLHARPTRTSSARWRTSGLLMIEQPLHHEDLVRHAELQALLRTDLCLDESIRSVADAAAALDLGACRIVNIKQGRVGGVLEARRIHDLCRERRGPRVVRRDARDRDRPGPQPGARGDARLHASRRHERVGPVLRTTTSPSRSSSRPTARWPSPRDPGSGSRRGRIGCRRA